MISKISSTICKVSYWLHITDGSGQLDIVDLSFMGIVIKMLYADTFDWQAVCAMLPLIASQMHTNQIDSKNSLLPSSPYNNYPYTPKDNPNNKTDK